MTSSLLNETVWLQWKADQNYTAHEKVTIIEIGNFYLVAHSQYHPDDIYIIPFWNIITIKNASTGKDQ